MVQLSECLEKSIIKLTNKIVKKKNSNNTSTKPLKVIVDTNGNKKISSMSYNKKKIHINRNGIGSRIGLLKTSRRDVLSKIKTTPILKILNKTLIRPYIT
jgi:hypothetical protein